MSLNGIIYRWLNRGQRFFLTVARNPVVRSGLAARGLTDEELARGWSLYSSVVGLNTKSVPPLPTPTQSAEAMNELDAWDAPNFNTAAAVLQHRTPKASAFLLRNLAPAEGPEAVVAVGQFLDRWDLLKANDAAGVSKKEAAEAVQVLAIRRIVDDSIAKHLRDLIHASRQGAKLPDGAIPTPNATEDKVEQERTFTEYRAWLHEWREVARTTFTRRDYLISLGLASRRTASADDSDDDDSDEPEDPGSAA